MIRAMLAVLFALAIAVPAGAQDCTPFDDCPEVCMGGLYVDNSSCQPDCAASVWVYEESNGYPNLQRDDQERDDTCGGEIEGDTLVAWVFQ